MANAFTSDALIVGAGPAGATAAIVLARAGWRVSLLHRAPGTSTWSQERGPQTSVAFVRTGETLPAASRASLQQLGVWSTFLQDGHVPSPGSVTWWDDQQPTERDSVFDPKGSAWHVDRPTFDRRLREAAVAAGADLVNDARVIDAQRIETRMPASNVGWTVALTRQGQASTCRTRMLIVATGRSRPTMPQCTVRRRLDRLIGLAAVVSAQTGTASSDLRIWIEATAGGWWYSAPMSSGACTVTFFTDADCLPRRDGRVALTEHWQEQLARTAHTCERVNGRNSAAATIASDIGPGSLQMIAADSYRQMPCCGHGWLAAGDAASAWDPLSGQGIEKALQSGLRAARAVDRVLCGDDMDAALTDYSKEEDALDQQYRRQRDAYYGRVRRWPTSTFWQRRAQPID